MIASSRGNPSRPRPPRGAPLAAALVAFAAAFAAALGGGCAGGGPPGPAAPAPIEPSYAALLGFNEALLRQGKGATEPFVPGDDVGAHPFNAHLRGVSLVTRPLLVATPEAPAGRRGEALGLADRWVEALRAQGVDARRDAVSGEPALLEAAARAASPLLLRARIASLDLGDRASLDASLWLLDRDGNDLGSIACRASAGDGVRAAAAPAWAASALASCLLGDPRVRPLLGPRP